ncbi:Arylsulfatase [Pirellulimonas nuda]|uniref:Arylsulfatase n=1 Tax=Pirellulimonas nuda TaxID=2528009 RepID=A0A518D8N2_9BACT|nr:sulfatase [Pirellulimonas nuda]QDU87814.1 Arylsulfatase [Pirellulimonas nuda]
MRFIVTLAFGAWLSSCVDARQPNVVFFLVDDLGYSDLGCFGSSFYETPNLDRLAESGVRLTSAYAACPVCSPTRASILSGKYPQRVGITDFINAAGGNQPENWGRNTPLLPAPNQDQLALQEQTLAEAFKDAGYATFFAGKWHLGSDGWAPEDQGFDRNAGGLEWGHPKGYFSPYRNPKLPDGPDGEHLTARLAEETCKFIRESADQPFLAYLSFYTVHTPLQSPKALEKKYQAKKRSEAPETQWGRESPREVRQTQNHPVYAGMVESMDTAVGRVLTTLEELGLADDTIVVFTSDNGGLSTSEGSPTSNLPLRGGKGWMYEGGIREPTIVRWPGHGKPGVSSDALVLSTDYYPTLLAMAGVPPRPQQHVDGVSFAPVLEGTADAARESACWDYPHYGNQGGSPCGAIRRGDWKLIHWYGSDRVELYNLADDIGEHHDLAESKPELRDELLGRLNAWRREVGAKAPTPNPKYKPAAKQR